MITNKDIKQLSEILCDKLCDTLVDFVSTNLSSSSEYEYISHNEATIIQTGIAWFVAFMIDRTYIENQTIREDAAQVLHENVISTLKLNSKEYH